MIAIRIDGQPIGKGRPRFSRKSGTAYTPEKTARYEDRLAWTAQSVMGGQALLSGPLSVTVNAHMEIPKSKSKRWCAEALGQQRRRQPQRATAQHRNRTRSGALCQTQRQRA